MPSLKTLDSLTLLPGPFALLLLVDMEADVLHVESSGRMNLMRVLPPYVDGTSASHVYLNRNKRSIGLDLKRRGTREVVLELVHKYDIVLEQLRLGVMDKLGAGYEALKAVNPQLIYVAITDYGQTRPYHECTGHDTSYLALTDVASYTRRHKRGPLLSGVQLAGFAGGSLHGVMGLLVVVIHRQQISEGQFVDIGMTDCALSLNSMAGAGYFAAGVEPEMGTLAPNGDSFYNYYRTRDNCRFSVGSLGPQFMQQLCAVIDHPGLAARGLLSKLREQRALRREIRTEFGKRDSTKWQAVFAAPDAYMEPLLPLPEMLEYPQLQAHGLVVRVPLVNGGSQAQMACSTKFFADPPAPRHISMALGTDTMAVLEGLGYSAERIVEPKVTGAIA